MAEQEKPKPKPKPLPAQTRKDPKDSRYDEASTFGKGWNW